MKATEQYFPAVLQWRIQGRAPPPPLLILDQTDAQRAEKKFKTALPLPQPPPFSRGLDDRAPSLSEGLDPPLYCLLYHTSGF